MKQPFDVVLRELEQERQCVDEDLKRFAVAHLRSLLPTSHRCLPRRRRCTPRRSLTP